MRENFQIFKIKTLNNKFSLTCGLDFLRDIGIVNVDKLGSLIEAP